VNDFTFRFGPDPRNAAEVDNDLQNVIQDFWSRNQARPSTFHTYMAIAGTGGRT